MSAPEAAPGLPRTTPAARHAAASNPTARPQRLFFNGHKTGLPGGPREADPATSAPSAPVGVLPTAQSAPPTPQAMGPAAGTGGTRVWGVRVPARAHAWWRDIGRGARGRRSRSSCLRAEPEHAAAAEANARLAFPPPLHSLRYGASSSASFRCVVGGKLLYLTTGAASISSPAP